MSKVDLQVFKDLLEKCEGSEAKDINALVYFLCQGDVGECVPWNGEYDDWVKGRDAFVKDIGYEHLEQDGGGEGGAEHCYGVFKLGDKIYRAEYSYYSHHGHEYDYITDSLEEVERKTKTVTVYVSK